MLHILARRHAHTLADFAASNVLLAFDFDGTLAPIVADPTAARMRASTRRLLAAVARRYPCIVISGRARSDVMKRVGSGPIVHVAGNHGLEPWDEDAAYAALVQRWVSHLQRRLRSFEGIRIEDKTYTVTVHYRQARPRQRAIAAIRSAVRGVRDAYVVAGKETVNLIPRGAPSKGAALERARRLFACDAAIYVGDDETDEAAFSAGRPEHLLAIRVGARGDSRARFRLRAQTEIDDLLRTLLAFRTAGRGGR